MKLILFVVAGIVALIVIVAVVGWLLPKGHVASRSLKYNRPPEAVWSAITDFRSFPQWRADVTSVEEMPNRQGHTVWREIGKHGNLTLEVVESNPPRRLVTRIADKDLPFGGSWTYEIEPGDGGSIVTITENGEVYNPIFRFVSRFVTGHHATIDAYLKALGKKLG